MAGVVNMEQFEAYFQRADLDRDGRISGAEAVSFFQGSNLPKKVLAQILMHADQNNNGYLSQPEFYNALKLVTVAQSKRELTPEIVRAALFGPASAKIPAPRINLAATPVPPSKPAASVPSPQLEVENISAETKDETIRSREIDSFTNILPNRKSKKKLEARSAQTSSSDTQIQTSEVSPGMPLKFILGVALVSFIVGIIIGKKY